MMARLGIIISSVLLSSVAFADNANTTSPDFVSAAPQRHIDRSLVASPDGPARHDPYTVVPFLHDNANLTAEGYDEVDTAARWLQKNPRSQVVLEGHTDAIGDAAYNEQLATRRMWMVRNRLLQAGISRDRIVLVNLGEREAMAEANPLHGADRKVVMYATELEPRQIVAMVRTDRPAIVAMWSERGTPMRVTSGLPQTARR